LLAPIVLFVYNRPEHIKLTVEALQKNTLAMQSDLIIYSDATKKPEAEVTVLAVREYIRDIKGFKSLTIIEQKTNFGLAKSIINGVSAVVNEYGKVIVLEDDLITSPYFLDYMNKALDTYQDEPQVMQISGHMFEVDVGCAEDAFFLPFTTSWGWATWHDRWAKFDASASAYVKLKADKSLVKQFNLNNSYPYFEMLKSQLLGKIDSWAIRWYLTVFMNKGLVLFPKITMVNNNGFDGTGVHCGDSTEYQSFVRLEENMLSQLPINVQVVEQYKKRVLTFLCSKQTSVQPNLLSLVKKIAIKSKALFHAH
jgi:hypothetical protein